MEEGAAQRSACSADTWRAQLEAQWLDLTRRVLPVLAAERRWPIRADHCFQRVLLDTAFEDIWYAHVQSRPAYRAISDDDLARAIGIANGVVEGELDLPALHRASLALRGIQNRRS